jgi:hypothetical protein
MPVPVQTGTAKPSGRGLLAALTLALLAGDGTATGLLLAEILEGGASQHERQWFGHVAALVTIILVSLLIATIRRVALQLNRNPGDTPQPVPGVLIGADNRLSTSKLSAFAWTWAIAWALLSLAFGDWVGAHTGWEALVKQGLQDEYLVLLGGPFVALIGAKALVTNGIANGTQVKPPADDSETDLAHRVTQAFSDDTGQTDLVDTQYLLFGSIALLVFIVMFLRDPTHGLPSLPEALIGLSSLGATAYIANKWTAKDAKPHLESVVPNSAKRGSTVLIYGSNLLSVSLGGKQAPASEPVEVIFGTLVVQDVHPDDPAAKSSLSGSDYIRLTVPYVPDAVLEPDGKRQVDVLLRNAIGVSSDNTLPFTIER